MTQEPAPQRFADLAQRLETLASAPRLELLHALRTPMELNEIRIRGEAAEEGRPLSRQAIKKHLETLRAEGLVHQVDKNKPGPRGQQYALTHDRLFALVDDVRSLARIRPLFEAPQEPGETLQRRDDARAQLPDPPRLYVAYGRDDGVAFGLHQGDAWKIGRGPGCAILLDYDPFLSAEHAVVERDGEGFRVRDLRSRNGTWVNATRLPSGGRAALATGDVLTVGRSALVLQAAT
jgi:DNA-binding transcriptional ArsR family regulator